MQHNPSCYDALHSNAAICRAFGVAMATTAPTAVPAATDNRIDTELPEQGRQRGDC